MPEVDDKRFNAERKRIGSLIKKWQRPMGLGWFLVNITYDRSITGSQAATTFMDRWQYREFDITFNVPMTVDLSDEEIERVVVHELSHCLLAPISVNMRGVEENNDYRRDIMEMNTELVVAALIWCRNAGYDDSKKEVKKEKK